MDDFADMNSVYMQYWGEIKPVRTYVSSFAVLSGVVLTGFRCVAVKTLPLNTDVEIECTATL